jgi:hypothetical protein
MTILSNIIFEKTNIFDIVMFYSVNFYHNVQSNLYLKGIQENLKM